MANTLYFTEDAAPEGLQVILSDPEESWKQYEVPFLILRMTLVSLLYGFI